ncbi:MAG: AAA family ATPase, partial [bacterium]
MIDEVQRLPSVLNTLQTIVDRRSPKPPRFFLTGSSARKLRRGQANLLPGRLLQFELGPCVYSELGDLFDLKKALAYGTLPGVYLDENEFDRRKVLETYAATYLKEEIQA